MLLVSDKERIQKRILSQTVAVGVLDVSEIVLNSVNQEDFLDVEPSLT
jgi:hypothetical protein